MRQDILLDLIYDKNFKKTLTYMRRYKAYLQNGITYENLYNILSYDYKIYLMKNMKTKNEKNIFILNEITNISTNIISHEDAMCKFKALTLARDIVYEK